MLSKVRGKVSSKSLSDKRFRNDHRVSKPMARCLDVSATAHFLGVNRRSVWRLVDRGTHEELLESSHVYRDIHASQLAEPDEMQPRQTPDGLFVGGDLFQEKELAS